MTTTLYFTRFKDDQLGVSHQATDEQGNVYIAREQGQGFTGSVYDPDWNQLYHVDWSDHRVHVDEMRKWLTRLHDTGELAIYSKASA